MTNKRTSKTYVLDTSVLLSDPLAMVRFKEHRVVIPLIVIVELEAKRSHVELGWMARRALRSLEEFRQQHDDISRPFVVNEDGGTVHVEVNNVDLDKLPVSIGSSNDDRILAVAHHLVRTGEKTVLVSKDLPLRLKASVVGVRAENYRFDSLPASDWKGVESIEVDEHTIDTLYRHGETVIDEELPVHTGVVLRSGNKSALGQVTKISTYFADEMPVEATDGSTSSGEDIVRGEQQIDPIFGFDNKELLKSSVVTLVKEKVVMGVRPRSAEQTLAVNLLLDRKVDIMSLGGKAGTGKTLLALAAAMHLVFQGEYPQNRIVVFRPLYAVGGQDLGYLPGDEGDKMAPWSSAIHDAIEAIDPTQGVLAKMKKKNILEILPITHIRGRTFSNAVIILEEAQQWERLSLLSLLTRVGENSKVFITHDITQRDNLRVGPHDGISAVVEMLKGNSLFGHVTLTRQERSAVAKLAGEILTEES